MCVVRIIMKMVHNNFNLTAHRNIHLLIWIYFSRIRTEINQTNGDANARPEEDVLYQKGASFSAKLDEHSSNNLADDSAADASDDSSDSDSDEKFLSSLMTNAEDDLQLMGSKLTFTARDAAAASELQPLSEDKSEATTAASSPLPTAVVTAMKSRPQSLPSEDISYYASKEEDVSMFDDVNNNRLNLRPANRLYQQQNFDASSDDASASTTLSAVTQQVEASSRSYIHIMEYKEPDPVTTAPLTTPSLSSSSRSEVTEKVVTAASVLLNETR